MHLSTTARSTPQLAASSDRALLKDTIELIRRLAGQFPQLAAAGADQKRMVAEWAQGLVDMQPQEVERGLATCRTRKFAPSLGEFCQLCRPALDPAWAWEEAREGLEARRRGELGVWSHPAVFRAASAMAYEIRTSGLQAVRVRWERELQRQFAQGWGDAVPPPPKGIEHAPTTRGASPEFIQDLVRRGFNLRGKKS